MIAALMGAGLAEGGLATLLAAPTLSYAAGTAALCLMVGAGALIIGAGAALAVCLTEFPGRRLVAILLALPFAIPAYVIAYAYGDILSPLGPVASVIGPERLPEIRSLPGAALVLTLATYPYVYLAVAASLASRSGALMEAARTLGARPLAAALSVLLPASRPAIAGGLALALMETAGDYGVADYFGARTLSVGIFRTWFGLGDLGAATQIAAILFFAALIFVVMEEAGRRGQSADSAFARKAHARIRLKPGAAGITLLLLSVPIMLGFALPAATLAGLMDPQLSPGAARGLTDAFTNTALVAAIGAALAASLALILGFSGRRARGRAMQFALRIATLGYAVPGAVSAIGVVALAAPVSGFLGAGAAGGLAILIYAYVARFLTVSYNGVAGGLAQVSPQMDAAAQMLGAGPARIIGKIQWPLARRASLAAAAIVAIDIAKELPATLLLRPFNYETLATRVYRLASDERLADAAPAALLLIAFGLIPVILVAGGLFGRSKRDQRAAARSS
ncbi:MAG: iron ABC transporter permease [Pseudomonadota bacterium]